MYKLHQVLWNLFGVVINLYLTKQTVLLCLNIFIYHPVHDVEILGIIDLYKRCFIFNKFETAVADLFLNIFCNN